MLSYFLQVCIILEGSEYLFVQTYEWVHGCGISKPNRFISKPLYELSHTYKQDAEDQCKLP